MGYETVERSFPCKCGQGKMIGAWQEHNTYPSNNKSITWRFECEACSEQYEFYHELLSQYVIRKSEADKLRAVKNDRPATKALGESIEKSAVPYR
jgi:hypothetical protein